ncbi:MAG: PLP-dependent aminotransferase family protein [Bacteroidetes bacterium]|nr:PLP-dependent aminotransferase family protein [Bacteroidota bacterium]
MKQRVSSRPDFLYARIVQQIEQQIVRQVLKPGDKLPSVRTLSDEQGVSLSTAGKAYAELENRGLIEAKSKSGYYVRRIPERKLAGRSQRIQKQLEQASAAEMIATVHEHLAEADVLRLSLSTPPLSLLPQEKLNKSMMEALRNSTNAQLQYEQVPGNPELRRQIAKQAFNWGGRVTEQDVVTTQGCMEALVFCLRALTKPGDVVAIESPAYFGIFNIIHHMGLQVLEIPVDPDTGIDIDFLQKAMDTTDIRACLFVTSFSNPAGSCMPDARKKALVELLTAKKIPLIEDDIYGDLYFGEQRPRTCKSFDKEGWVLLCSSVSKSLAPGYRVGWCMPGRFKELFIRIKQMHTISSASPTQAAIAHFFATGRYDLHMRRLRKALQTQCRQYTDAILRYFPAGTKPSRPKGGYTLWIEMDTGINAIDVYQRAIAQKISIAPGQLFSTDGRYTHCLRISFGQPYDKAVDEGLRTLGNIVQTIFRQL